AHGPRTSLNSIPKFLAVKAQFRFGIDRQSIGFDGFVASQIQTIPAVLNAAKHIVDPSYLFTIPFSQKIKETDSSLVGFLIDPLGVLLNLMTLFGEMPQGQFDLFLSLL